VRQGASGHAPARLRLSAASPLPWPRFGGPGSAAAANNGGPTAAQPQTVVKTAVRGQKSGQKERSKSGQKEWSNRGGDELLDLPVERPAAADGELEPAPRDPAWVIGLADGELEPAPRDPAWVIGLADGELEPAPRDPAWVTL
jgi:hypothetical protein